MISKPIESMKTTAILTLSVRPTLSLTDSRTLKTTTMLRKRRTVTKTATLTPK
jgi:hypothetical protein